MSVLRPSLALLLLLLALSLLGAAPLVGSRLLERPPEPRRLACGLDGDVYLADWDGRNPPRVADGAAFDDSEGPSFELVGWAPDGHHFLYLEIGRRRMTHISDASGRVVASFPGVDDSVQWSPDSTRLQAWTDAGSGIAIYGIDGRRQSLIPLLPALNGSGRTRRTERRAVDPSSSASALPNSGTCRLMARLRVGSPETIPGPALAKT